LTKHIFISGFNGSKSGKLKPLKIETLTFAWAAYIAAVVAAAVVAAAGHNANN